MAENCTDLTVFDAFRWETLWKRAYAHGEMLVGLTEVNVLGVINGHTGHTGMLHVHVGSRADGKGFGAFAQVKRPTGVYENEEGAIPVAAAIFRSPSGHADPDHRASAVATPGMIRETLSFRHVRKTGAVGQ